jgi:hypothetical protein
MSLEINLLNRLGPPPKPNTDSTHPRFDRQQDQETTARQLRRTQGLLRTPPFNACPERSEAAADAGLKPGATGVGGIDFTSKATMCFRMSKSENDRPIRNSGAQRLLAPILASADLRLIAYTTRQRTHQLSAVSSQPSAVSSQQESTAVMLRPES